MWGCFVGVVWVRFLRDERFGIFLVWGAYNIVCGEKNCLLFTTFYENGLTKFV